MVYFYLCCDILNENMRKFACSNDLQLIVHSSYSWKIIYFICWSFCLFIYFSLCFTQPTHLNMIFFTAYLIGHGFTSCGGEISWWLWGEIKSCIERSHNLKWPNHFVYRWNPHGCWCRLVALLRTSTFALTIVHI